jgi:hypothetical protein
MANRRMLHKTISISVQVNSLDEFTQLLFTWCIPHLDDFGKINGDANVIKALVMPMSTRPIADFEESIETLIKVCLIERYTIDGISVIEYPSFERHQIGLDKRTKSKFPQNPRNSKNFQEISGNSHATEENRTEDEPNENGKEDNLAWLISENKGVTQEEPEVINYAQKSRPTRIAYDAWKKLEPDNMSSFRTTYLAVLDQGLPVELFEKFTEEISRDKKIKDKGAAFKKKVSDYYKKINI